MLPMHLHERLTLAQAQQDRGDWLAAAVSYAALAVDHPADHRFLANQANALWLADLPGAASQCYARALQIRPGCPVSRKGLASCLRDLNQFEAALLLHRQLEAELAPASVDGLANLWAHSQVLIGLERFSEAFHRMACRRPWADGVAEPNDDPLATDLLLISEQGFGDTLQFVRFLEPLVTRRRDAGLRGGVLLLVESALVELLREGLSWLPDPPEVRAKSEPLPAQAITLLDLPHALQQEQVAPAHPDAAYLLSSCWTEHQAAVLGLLPGLGGMRVGLVTASGKPLGDPFCHREFQKRTLPESIVWRLVQELRERGAQLVDLQFGAEAARHQALGLDLLQPALSLAGFAATARVVAQLDLVISVDTAMAHLIGAMGRECWVLLPWSADPRWGRHGSTCCWYARSRLFRQPRPGDWNAAVDQLLETFTRAHVNRSDHP
jgi:hypothetical protein